MLRRIFPVLAIVAAAGCGGGGPQQPSVPGPGMVLMSAPPIYSLLGYREDLGLDAGQISSLDSIAQQLQQEEGPLLETLRDGTGTRGNRTMAVGEEAASAFQEIRASRERAVDGVRDVLTAEQRTEVCEQFQDQGDSRRMRREGNRAGRTRGRGNVRGMEEMELGGTAVWPWCRSSSTPADSVATTP